MSRSDRQRNGIHLTVVPHIKGIEGEIREQHAREWCTRQSVMRPLTAVCYLVPPGSTWYVERFVQCTDYCTTTYRTTRCDVLESVPCLQPEHLKEVVGLSWILL
jgi:hypothetical protein